MNIDYIQSVSGTAYIISLLPTQEDIKKIIYHEKKFQLKDEAYWTRDAGLVSGKRVNGLHHAMVVMFDAFIKVKVC